MLIRLTANPDVKKSQQKMSAKQIGKILAT